MENIKVEVHLKNTARWWTGDHEDKIEILSLPLDTIHLEVIEGESYIIMPFFVSPEDYQQGQMFPIEESPDWVMEIKAKHEQLKEEQRKSAEFMKKWIYGCKNNTSTHEDAFLSF